MSGERYTDIMMNGVRVIGGPAAILIHTEHCEPFAWDGPIVRRLEMVVATRLIEVSFIIPGGGDLSPYRQKLAGCGVRLSEGTGPRGKLVRLGLYSWRLAEGMWVPSHWLARGLPVSLALYRIFGPEEWTWPQAEAVS